MKSELSRINHEQQSMKEKIKVYNTMYNRPADGLLISFRCF